MPLMYLESMVDGAMKGMGEQKAAFRYSVWDAVLRIGGVAVLLPRYGMKGFLTVILLSSFTPAQPTPGSCCFPAAQGTLLPAVAGCAAGSCCRRCGMAVCAGR